MLIRWTVALLVVSTMTACAISQASLTPVSDGSAVSLPENVKYIRNHVEFSLSQGEYRAAFADQKGTYYQGPPLCFRTKLLEAGWGGKHLQDKIFAVFDCVLYVPRDSRSDTVVYTVNGTGASTNFGHSLEDVDAAIASAASRQPSSPASRTSDGVNSLVAASVVNTSLTPAQAGAAGGLAGALVAGIVAVEKGKFETAAQQPTAEELKNLVHIPAREK
ncbi:hypothetical protein [Massilia sp. BKSP1R2A-1]|uniref:hypothetical protein n=1 Tax=Massilia sp. BKSP1R2A-1 TaxID=3422595 RepID=UPI003D34C347